MISFIFSFCWDFLLEFWSIWRSQPVSHPALGHSRCEDFFPSAYFYPWRKIFRIRRPEDLHLIPGSVWWFPGGTQLRMWILVSGDLIVCKLSRSGWPWWWSWACAPSDCIQVLVHSFEDFERKDYSIFYVLARLFSVRTKTRIFCSDQGRLKF